MNSNRLARAIIQRIAQQKRPPGAQDAKQRLENRLQRLADSIGTNYPDSAAGWLALLVYGQDRTEIDNLCLEAARRNDPRYTRAVEIMSKAQVKYEAR